ncbi:hypothetical protein D3Z45_09380 [Lachnospiraceae bacterium]|nr:hypothetical protein [Lachnospiraceae bacterium]
MERTERCTKTVCTYDFGAAKMKLQKSWNPISEHKSGGKMPPDLCASLLLQFHKPLFHTFIRKQPPYRLYSLCGRFWVFL